MSGEISIPGNVPMIPNGGKTITVNGVEIKVLSGYRASWVSEYSESETDFTTWDGRKKKTLTGIRFKLSFSLYGMSSEDVTALSEALKPDAETGEIELECSEFTGAVYCEDFTAEVQSANHYGEYYKGNVSLSAVDAEVPPVSGDGL